ncbi:hypothetical protein F9B85_10155 [Heliorestis acidaminivorans]|uniref:LexA repressor DNA-binding domain-containing protein n=1 Tax=Heliorestis acidaminivorans TaxID=553427 RepID=A0A6I0EZT2_9FIRM|nr:hypothetical protein [Heliorestis acidaminivorans]KAB2952165.1 hypothetical protein F9B85_10155 [Heliorestis acidaminivorans]
MELTRQEINVLAFIQKYVSEHSYTPSIREISDAVNLKSTSSIHRYIKILESKGHLHVDPNKPRTIVLKTDEEFELEPEIEPEPVTITIEGNTLSMVEDCMRKKNISFEDATCHLISIGWKAEHLVNEIVPKKDD